MADFNDDDIKTLHGAILGQELDPSSFISTGPVAKRTVLTTEEKIVTRILNAIDQYNNQTLGMVDAFTGRFNNVVGYEIEEDKEAYEAIKPLGGNILQAVAKLKGNLETLLKTVSNLGAGTVQGINVLGTYDSYDDLVADHPTGDINDSYFVGDELYVWSENDNDWKNIGNIRGPKGEDGTSVTILGSYDEYEDLESEHPTGSKGDSYLVNGSLYIWSENAESWVDVGKIRGPQGAKGNTGPRGPQGNAGAVGPRGNPGPEGPDGPQGSQGHQGNQGPKGDQGVPGPEGSQGPKGDKGSKGDKGDTGKDGAGVTIKGSFDSYALLSSVTGSVGDAYMIDGDLYVWSENARDWINVGNIRGPRGDKGDTGDRGDKGDKGDAGAAGSKGDKGDKGDNGDEGPIGAEGHQGPKGDTGEAGPTGPKGDRGDNAPNSLITTSVAATDGFSTVLSIALAYKNADICAHYDISSFIDAPSDFPDDTVEVNIRTRYESMKDGDPIVLAVYLTNGIRTWIRQASVASGTWTTNWTHQFDFIQSSDKAAGGTWYNYKGKLTANTAVCTITSNTEFYSNGKIVHYQIGLNLKAVAPAGAVLVTGIPTSLRPVMTITLPYSSDLSGEFNLNADGTITACIDMDVTVHGYYACGTYFTKGYEPPMAP